MNIARNSIIIFVAKILLSLVTFTTLLVIARVLGPKGLGIYSLFLAVVGLATNFGNFGLGSASLYLLNKEKRDMSMLFSNVLVFGFLWGVLVAAILAGFSAFFPYVFSLPTVYFIAGFAIVPLHLMIMYLLPFFTARFEILWWSFFSMLYPIFVFVSTMVAIFLFGLGVAGAVLAIAVSSIAMFLLLVAVLWKRYNLHFQPNFLLFKEQIHFGLRSYIGELFNTIHFKFNTFMASFFVRIVPIGYFSAALNMISILFFLPFSFQITLNPFWSSKPVANIDEDTSQSARKALILGIAGALLFIPFARPFILLLFGQSFEPAFKPLLFLIPGFIASAFSSILFTNFFARGKPQFTSIILLGALGLNALLNFAALPRFGIEGSAASMSISLIAASIFASAVFSKISHTPFFELFFLRFSDIRSLAAQFRAVLHHTK